MFSGIVESIGIVKFAELKQNLVLHIQTNLKQKITIGDSIAINGVCLTVTEIKNTNIYCFDVIPESLSKTNLGLLKIGDLVNTEGSLCVGDAIGGHQVQGHVDGLAEICEINKLDNSWNVSFELPKTLSQYLTPKDFITIDGMSITIVDITQNQFTVSLIPHTITNTIVKNYKVNQKINIEIHIMAKMIKQFLQEQAGEPTTTI